jgi:threonine dehydrogenase-like Zn-dependent dehydrogenase
MSGIGKDDGIAVIGLGKMGLPMARNLRTAGFRVVGYDPVASACEAASEFGVEIVESPAAATASTAIALIVVGFDNEVEQVVTAEGTGLLAGAKPSQLDNQPTAPRWASGLTDALPRLSSPTLTLLTLALACTSSAPTARSGTTITTCKPKQKRSSITASRKVFMTRQASSCPSLTPVMSC